RAEGVARVERPGEVTDGVIAGTHQDDAPGRAGLAHHSANQCRQQPGAHQRRLAAARRADHRQEARALELLDQAFDLIFASEEEMTFGKLKWPKSGEGVLRGGDLGQSLDALLNHCRPPRALSICSMNGINESQVNSAKCEMTMPSRTLKSSLTLVRGPLR